MQAFKDLLKLNSKSNNKEFKNLSKLNSKIKVFYTRRGELIAYDVVGASVSANTCWNT